MQRRARTLLVSGAIFAAAGALVALLSTISNRRGPIITFQKDASSIAHPPSPAQSKPTPPLIASPGNNTSLSAPETASGSPAKLIIPVAGVRPEQLRDTFAEARSEGRVHDAIDIPAALGTPVIAAADGPIVKLLQSERGGTTIYQLSTDGKFVYYYAHLDRYAEGLAEGHFAKQGEMIAYVGDSGNAGSGNYHLHFSIAQISNPKDFWHGVNIDPYPLLRK
ncbi:MAG TPA: M23 family metallopeptidase [Pyrinomonadaceae bacterium]|nr:M23 family metallopeptidase [Pyrinomonadaceae bacterium]